VVGEWGGTAAVQGASPERSWGRRITETELRDSFADGWRIDAIDATTIDITMEPWEIQAWLVAVTRI